MPRMRIARLALLLTSVSLAACAQQRPAATATAAPLLIESRGVTMPLQDAVRKIAFRPFVPAAQLAAVAVIPPLGGEDTRDHRGIAMEYVSNGSELLLSQWPRQGFAIAVGGADLSRTTCSPVPFMAGGLMWTTRAAVVMTLQPDGELAPQRVATEARRLIAGGACR